MDADRKRELKAWGKAEVARRSAELDASLRESNPAPVGSDAWAAGYRVGTERERWLRRRLPVLHAGELHRLFVVEANHDAAGAGGVGSYVVCDRCGSATPAAIGRRWFYWASCACGNVRWRCVLGWRRGSVADPSAVLPVKLIGRA